MFDLSVRINHTSQDGKSCTLPVEALPGCYVEDRCSGLQPLGWTTDATSDQQDVVRWLSSYASDNHFSCWGIFSHALNLVIPLCNMAGITPASILSVFSVPFCKHCYSIYLDDQKNRLKSSPFGIECEQIADDLVCGGNRDD